MDESSIDLKFHDGNGLDTIEEDTGSKRPPALTEASADDSDAQPLYVQRKEAGAGDHSHKADWTNRIHIKKGNVGDSDPADVKKDREDADGNVHADDHSVTLSACAVHMTIRDEDVHEVDSFVWDESKGNYKHLGSPRRITPWLHLKKQSRRERYRSRHNKILATVVWKGWRVVIARLGRDTWRGSHGRSLLTANSKGMKNLMEGKCAEFQIQRI
ncbi:hypothetical protein ISF_09885 [Cordyceps fumosorosea ARSEF 2679]|uniref:Uncharacterized protein n=1 Tax=Cordyceps fumosorosea (strain ARSEF 2679) TaxID=1081104 RepID=A0A167A3X9_CORFA|nr:hypothetical protein ISF_09885 [Cordyceps fumosorosea ARSEF 2679]OAA38527.1 hypothetical protein ISF_09885 [Cordyceps fumosorosea ARSEF 2679]